MATPPRTTTALTPAVVVRALRFEDVAEALRVLRRAVEHGCRDDYDARQRDAVFASYAPNMFIEGLGPVDSLVATRAGQVIAVAQMDPADGRLRALFVDARDQHRGVGRALLAEIETRARRHGLARLHGAMSLNAVPFYRRAGFRPIAGVERLISSRIAIPIQRMEKLLTAPAAPPPASAV
jgi:GNAT superfamily N-acetyltransferase